MTSNTETYDRGHVLASADGGDDGGVEKQEVGSSNGYTVRGNARIRRRSFASAHGCGVSDDGGSHASHAHVAANN